MPTSGGRGGGGRSTSSGGTIRKHSSDTDTPTPKPAMKKSAVDCSTGELMDAIKQIDSKLETRLVKVMQEQQSLRATMETRFSNISERIDKECKDIKDEFHIAIAMLTDQVKNMETKVYAVEQSTNVELLSLRSRVEKVDSHTIAVFYE